MCVSGSPFSQALRAPKGPDQVYVSDCMRPGARRLLSEAVSDPGWHSWGSDMSPHNSPWKGLATTVMMGEGGVRKHWVGV